MPRLVRRSRVGTLDAKHLAALLYGRPLGIPHRRHGIFWSGFFLPSDLATLRQLWRQNRETLTAQFQKLHPGLLPWAATKFDTPASISQAE